MHTAAHSSRTPLPDGTYVELVGSLCSTRLPAVIMTGLFLMVGTLAALRSDDGLLFTTFVLGLFASIARLVILFDGRRRIDAGTMSLSATRAFERRFAASYIAFAAIFGCFSARLVMLPVPQLHMAVGILVVGYAAGVAATVALRPRIAVSSLLLSTVPLTLTIAAQADLEHGASALCLAALLVGGVRSLQQRYRSQSAKTIKRQAFAELARRDHLTGLDNRLALVEAFERLRRSAPGGMHIAVHYMDLDDFKPVNDRLGHPTGDAVLRAVAERLRTEAAPTDIVARLGGDEFVFVQTGIATARDVTDKAARLETALSAPLQLDDQSIVVGASVGSSGPAPVDLELDILLRDADDRLRVRKTQRKTMTVRTRG